MEDQNMRKGKFGKNAYEQGSHSDCCTGEVVAKWHDNGKAFGAAKYYDEPIQGCAKDCFFIAALKAIAYKANNTLTSTGSTFSFLNTETMQNESISLANKKLAYTATDKLVYARNAKTDNRWPMLYEKAYALWFDQLDAGKCWDAVDPTQPDIKCIFNGGGNGITAMMNISRYRTKFEKQPIAFSGNTVMYPTVAATRDIDPTQLRLPDQLTRKHTYSIYRKDSTYYYLIDPCNNSEKRVALAYLTTNKFDTWGYVRP